MCSSLSSRTSERLSAKREQRSGGGSERDPGSNHKTSSWEESRPHSFDVEGDPVEMKIDLEKKEAANRGGLLLRGFHCALDLIGQGREVCRRPGEQFTLLFVRRQAANNGALSCFRAQLLQVRLHVLHSYAQNLFGRERNTLSHRWIPGRSGDRDNVACGAPDRKSISEHNSKEATAFFK